MPPLNAIPASSAQWLVKVLLEDGLAADVLLKDTGLPTSWSDMTDTTLSASQYEQLVSNALQASSDAALGFSVSRQINYLSRYGFWGYAVMSCTTVGEALETSIRYWPLTGSLLKLRLEHSTDSVRVHLTPAFAFVQGIIWRFAVEKFLSTTRLSLNWMLERPAGFSGVVLRAEAPIHGARYSELLGCPVQFDGDGDFVELDRTFLLHPLVTSQPQLADLCRERCAQAMLQMQGRDDFVGSIQDLVWNRLSNLPSLDEVARGLHLTPRTLRRRLQERGMSFQRILDNVRETVARDYLHNTSLSIEQIATLVGFSEPTTFRSTFKRWTGQSAAELRRSSRP